ncbi:MAG: cytochrome P460 family protein [Steroidobacteraceae bacterium]
MLKRVRPAVLVSGCLLVAALAVGAPPVAPVAGQAPVQQGAKFTEDGKLQRPEGFRDWQFVTAGVGMSYGPAAQAAALSGHVMFDNVFVQPEAYQSFRKHGVWPEGTMFVLELRGSETERPPNNRGYFQTDVHAVEVSVKDSKRFKGRWAYFEFGMDAATASQQPESGCYACHAKSAAVDMTFTQFYPTLQDVKPAN